MAEKKVPKIETVKEFTHDAEFHDFDADPTLLVQYIQDWVSENGENKGYLWKKTDGTQVLTGRNKAIADVVNSDDRDSFNIGNDNDYYLLIEFLGKIQTKNGQEFSRFKIRLVKIT